MLVSESKEERAGKRKTRKRIKEKTVQFIRNSRRKRKRKRVNRVRVLSNSPPSYETGRSFSEVKY